MKVRFTENEIIVVDELNNSVVIDKDTVMRVFNLEEKSTNKPSLVEIVSSLPPVKKPANWDKTNLPVEAEEERLPESVARRYDPVVEISESTEALIDKFNEALFKRVFGGRIETVPFDELPDNLKKKYYHSIHKYELARNFKKNFGVTVRSVRISKAWQIFQKEQWEKYHEMNASEKEA